MHIRPAVLADAAALAHIQVTGYRTAYAPILPTAYLAQFSETEQTQDWRDLLADAGTDRALVAEQGDGRVIAYALTRIAGSENADGIGELVAMHVLPSCQRRGMGRRLFAAAAADLSQRGASTLQLWVLARSPIRAWYEKLDGQPAGTQQYAIDGVTIEEVAYKWPDIERLRRALAC